MTTTTQFQTIPDFFSKKEKIILNQTNPRYPSYNQIYFTAGDIEQFEKYKDETNGDNQNPNIDFSDNIWKNEEKIEEKNNKKNLIGEHLDWIKYQNINTESVNNTFNYLFNKFKKGVFVKIKNNKLSVFLPFSKNNYTNEWGNRMIQPKTFKDMNTFLIYTSKIQGYDIKHENINKFTNKWYANNCLIRSEYPIKENDRCLSNLKDLLLTLCETRVIPDIELFFNRRDFPLIKKDDTEPYENIYDSEKFPLISHKYNKYCPILSMVTTNTNTDIPFPTMEDWARVSYEEDKKLFYPDFKDYKTEEFNLNWESKKSIAVFRGTSTGCGVTIEKNPRLKLANLSKTYPDIIDAGITKFNCRPRKIMNIKELQIIDPSKLDLDLVSFLSPKEQSNYKYIINVDGHVSAFRLSWELSMGSVILLQESKYRVWFRKYLIEYVHYIPIKEDLSDILEKIKWCKENDDKCKEIAINSLNFYKTYLTKKGILDFTQLLFFNIKNISGTYFYNTIKVKDIIYKKQIEKISFKKDENVSFSYPFLNSDINTYGGFQIFLERHLFPYDKIKNNTEIHNSKDSIINSCTLDNLNLSLKKSIRQYELINEGFVGLKCINKLLKDIPNFKYTFGFTENKELITEYIDGISFNEYIKTCSIDDFIGIIKILFLAISVAQENCGFLHNDLTSWNIIIKKLKKNKKIVYQFRDYIFTVETNIIPIIIDYDKAHVIYNDKEYGSCHYGIVNPFNSSLFQDCFCLIVNSLFEYCNTRNLSQKELDIIYYIINFMTNTEFHKKQINNYKELMDFLTTNKKYNEIVYKSKCDLESFHPIDYYMYINKINIINNFNIQHVDGKKVIKQYEYINPLFYYYMIISENNHKHIISYIDKIETQIKYIIEKFLVNYIYYIHSVNLIFKTLMNLKQFIENYKNKKTPDEYFIQKRNIDRTILTLTTQINYKQIFQEYGTCGHITETDKNMFCKICNKIVEKAQRKSNILLYPNCIYKFCPAKFNSLSFSIPSRILTILQGNSDIINENCINIRNMLRDILLFDNIYNIPNEKEFSKKYGKILSDFSCLSIINHNANINSLKMMSKIIYENDKKEIKLPKKNISILNNILNLI